MKSQTTLRRGVVLTVWLYLARLVFAAQTPGSLDETFQPEFGGVNAPITALLVQHDQRIVVTQAPLSFAPNGEGISRWLPDGRVDTSFQIGDGSDQQYGVITMIEQLDG